MSVPVLASLAAAGFLARFAGATAAISRRAWSMPWAMRAASWAFFGLAALLLASAGALVVFAAFGAFVVVDALAGLVKREVTDAPPKPVKKRSWRGFWATTGVLAYLGAVAAFHGFIGQYLPFGILVTWSLLSLGFTAALLVTLRGPKATEAHLLPPQDHRRHERREERVADPERVRAEAVLDAFRARGDAGPFLDLVRDAARAADLREEDVRALEDRILGAFARAGTDRDADVRSALDEVERFLTLRNRPLETRP